MGQRKCHFTLHVEPKGEAHGITICKHDEAPKKVRQKHLENVGIERIERRHKVNSESDPPSQACEQNQQNEVNRYPTDMLKESSAIVVIFSFFEVLLAFVFVLLVQDSAVARKNKDHLARLLGQSFEVKNVGKHFCLTPRPLLNHKDYAQRLMIELTAILFHEITNKRHENHAENCGDSDLRQSTVPLHDVVVLKNVLNVQIDRPSQNEAKETGQPHTEKPAENSLVDRIELFDDSHGAANDDESDCQKYSSSRLPRPELLANGDLTNRNIKNFGVVNLPTVQSVVDDTVAQQANVLACVEARQGKPPDAAELLDSVVDFGVHIVVERLRKGCLQDQAQEEGRAVEAHVEVGPLSLL